MSFCPDCGIEFACGMQEGGGMPCWCMRKPALHPLPVSTPRLESPKTRGAHCFCPACLQRRIEARQNKV